MQLLFRSSAAGEVSAAGMMAGRDSSSRCASSVLHLCTCGPLLQVSDNGTLVNGAFIRVGTVGALEGSSLPCIGHPTRVAACPRLQDWFLGWECAGAGGVIHFFTRSTD